MLRLPDTRETLRYLPADCRSCVVHLKIAGRAVVPMIGAGCRRSQLEKFAANTPETDLHFDLHSMRETRKT